MESPYVELTIVESRALRSVIWIGDLSDENSRRGEPGRCNTDEEASGDKHGLVTGASLEGCSEDNEDEPYLKANFASITICAVGLDWKRDQASDGLDSVDKPKPCALGMIHECLPLKQ